MDMADGVHPFPCGAMANVVNFLDCRQVKVVGQIGPVAPEGVSRSGNIVFILDRVIPHRDVPCFPTRDGLGAGLSGQKRTMVRPHLVETRPCDSDGGDVEGSGITVNMLGCQSERRAATAY